MDRDKQISEAPMERGLGSIRERFAYYLRSFHRGRALPTDSDIIEAMWGPPDMRKTPPGSVRWVPDPPECVVPLDGRTVRVVQEGVKDDADA